MQEAVDNDEDEIVIPSVEEMLANPVPSTSTHFDIMKHKKEDFCLKNLNICQYFVWKQGKKKMSILRSESAGTSHIKM